MQVTKIAKIGKDDKFGVFIDGTLKLFLSGQAILDSGLSVGEDVTKERINELLAAGSENQLFTKALKYLNLRMRTEGEMHQYLGRKGASVDQQKSIMARLKDLGLINDEKYTEAFIRSKLEHHPASKRRLAYELKNKQIAEDIIESSLSSEQFSDDEALKKLIEKKRQQTRYQDDLKLMQYLVRNGFKYGDVKRVMSTQSEA